MPLLPSTPLSRPMIGGLTIPRISQAWATCLSVGLLALVATGDCLTAWYYIFDFFYLIPLSVMTIYMGKRAGYLMSLVCTMAWTIALSVQGHPIWHRPESTLVIGLWNFLMRNFAQSSFVWLLAGLLEDAARQRILVSELQEALDHVNQLRNLIPICAWCKKVRNDAGYWEHVELYLQERDVATFTHGICPECERKAFGD